MGHFLQRESATRKSTIFAIRNFHVFCNTKVLLQPMLKFLISKMVDFRVAQNVRLWCCKKARFCRGISHCCEQFSIIVLLDKYSRKALAESLPEYFSICNVPHCFFYEFKNTNKSKNVFKT